jgi:predicted outer membrane repeat protein
VTRPFLHQFRLMTLAVVGVAAAAVVLVSPARAATFAVTNTNDSGPGSLRQAVADANAAPGADTITFSIGGTITLASGPLVGSGDLTIDGPGAASLTVSGSHLSGILWVGSGGRLAVRDVTLADGSASSGGAILNVGGRVDIANVVFSGNTASSYGGAIENASGAVTVFDSTFSGNSAFAGGAIENANGATLTVERSTFSGNSALPGGAISNLRGTVEITNSTFTGNSGFVGGALYNLSFATIQVTNSTFSGNSASASQGDAIENLGLDVTVANSIFAGNPCQGPIVDGGGNLDWPESTCPGINGDPRLGALSDNGGPTETMALGPGSAAIDAALAALCPATDQRGVARPQGAGCDIGAYESDVDTTPPVLTVPGDLVVDATGPEGAAVAFEASATDDVDGTVPVTCAPPSGSTFPIGDTTVTCVASDPAGNEGSASFTVHVRDAGEQLERLIVLATGLGPGTSLFDKLQAAEIALDGGDVEGACERLSAFVREVEALSGKKLTPLQATQLIAAANRIRAVLDC